MNRKRLMVKNLSFIWNGLIHLSDGSQWTLVDPAREHDVTWWQTGDVVKLDHRRGAPLLRNLSRDESVPIVSASERFLELAA